MVDGTGISVNTSEGTLSEMLRDSLEVLSSGERKVARTILANYPIAGLETVAELAEMLNSDSRPNAPVMSSDT